MFLEQIEKCQDHFNHLFYLYVKPLMSAKRREYRFQIICNEYLDASGVDNRSNVSVIRVTQRELTNNWNYKPLTLLEGWAKGDYDQENLDYYCDIFRSKITEYPDLILSITDVPFLSKLFSNALLLGCNLGFFCRPPYPHTVSYFLGDAGMHMGSYACKYLDSVLSNNQLTENSLKLVTSFKNAVTELLKKTNPYNDLVEILRKKYDYLYILPLSLPSSAGNAKAREYNSDFHFLLDVLDNTPDNVGIIVTMHPSLLDYMDKEMISFLGAKYNNFIYDSTFSEYLSVSQFLLPEVDGIICRITSLALQAMTFDKKIITIGDDFLKGIRDHSSISEFVDNLDKPARNRDDLLYWFITRHCITPKYYLDSEWLDGFFIRSLEKYRNREFEDFYDLIDDPEVVINYLINNLNGNFPSKRTG